MATIPDKKIAELKNLYNKQNYSAQMIAEELKYPLNAVYYAMRKHKVHRRSQSQNSKIQFEQKPLSYKIKSPLNSNELSLKQAGTILYWTEGYKTAKSGGIDFANSDVEMQKLFISFLRNVCGVDEKRIRVYLYCHANAKQKKLLSFWSQSLQVPLTQFTKPYVRTDYRLDKKNKMPYGLVHIRYSDKKLLSQILIWIDECKEKFCVGT